MLQAANAFAKSKAPYKTVIYDGGCTVRELNEREEILLERVCYLLGLEVQDA